MADMDVESNIFLPHSLTKTEMVSKYSGEGCCVRDVWSSGVFSFAWARETSWGSLLLLLMLGGRVSLGGVAALVGVGGRTRVRILGFICIALVGR